MVGDIPAEIKDSFRTFLQLSADDFAKRNFNGDEHLSVSDGIAILSGKERAYDSLVVKQEKGIFIIERPYSNANSENVLKYMRRQISGPGAQSHKRRGED